jgi:hypothetical protein
MHEPGITGFVFSGAARYRLSPPGILVSAVRIMP